MVKGLSLRVLVLSSKGLNKLIKMLNKNVCPVGLEKKIIRETVDKCYQATGKNDKSEVLKIS